MDLDLILRGRRLRWFGHVERSSGAIRTACDIQIDGRRGAGRPKLTWKKLTERDCREWKFTTVDPQERSTWRSGVRLLCMQLASYLERGPLMWMMSLHLHVNQKSDYDDDMIASKLTENAIILCYNFSLSDCHFPWRGSHLSLVSGPSLNPAKPSISAMDYPDIIKSNFNGQSHWS